MRAAALSRRTAETDIALSLSLDGSGRHEIDTGIGFFDHMLTALCVHAGLDLTLRAKGDLAVDCHHTVEDVGIVLGRALGEALGDKAGIARYGSAFIPMDETLAFCCVDVSGRPFLVFEAAFDRAMMGAMETAMVEEFFRAVAVNAGITLHLRVLYGRNDHHRAEALFKSFAHALRDACAPARQGPLSTKGVL